MNLVCGVRAEVRDYFEEVVKAQGLEGCADVKVIGGGGDEEYFDYLQREPQGDQHPWTKPSGDVLLTWPRYPDHRGPHDRRAGATFNRNWLEEIQAGIPQADPRYAHEWLFELLEQGRFAEAAWSGFLKARKYGTYKIHELIATGTMARSGDPLTR